MMLLCVTGCVGRSGASSSAALCQSLLYIEPSDDEIDALSPQTREDILQNNLTLAEVCGE